MKGVCKHFLWAASGAGLIAGCAHDPAVDMTAKRHQPSQSAQTAYSSLPENAVLIYKRTHKPCLFLYRIPPDLAYLTFPDDSMLINTNTGLILQSGLVTLLSSKNENACQNNVSNRFSTAFPIRYLASQSLRTALESPRQNEAVIANATLTDFSQGSGPKAYLIGTSIDRIEPSYQGKAIGLEKAIRFLRHYKPTSKNVAEVHKSQHQFKEERQDWLDEKSRRVSNWDNRYDLEYSEGDRVCTYDNRFGRIISQSDQHVRVRVQGVVNSEPDGVFFTMPYRTFIHSRGRFGNYTNEQFRYRRLNRVAWWDLGSFSRCSMSDVNEPG